MNFYYFFFFNKKLWYTYHGDSMECREDMTFCWQEYSLRELQKLPSCDFFINQYNLYIEYLKKQNRFNRELVIRQYGLPVSKIEENCFYNLEKYMDEDGNIMAFYPVMKEVRSSKIRTCCFSGSIIRKGSIYIYYRPFLENIITHTRYVLEKPICAELSYNDELPKNYMEFHYMDSQLQSGNDFYYDFSVNYGSDSLKLTKLNRKS